MAEKSSNFHTVEQKTYQIYVDNEVIGFFGLSFLAFFAFDFDVLHVSAITNCRFSVFEASIAKSKWRRRILRSGQTTTLILQMEKMILAYSNSNLNSSIEVAISVNLGYQSFPQISHFKFGKNQNFKFSPKIDLTFEKDCLY